MRRFLFDTIECDENHVDFGELLSRAYRSKIRPLCLCRAPGVPMAVADIGDQLVIKRMPLTGSGHDPACSSYEPPYELSGLGPLLGNAIRPDAAAGVVSLQLDFSLSRRGRSLGADVTGQASNSVKTHSKKLSLLALLHFLWHESGLTEWTARWNGRRHWWQVYHHLLEAAGNMAVRGESLQTRLLLPEPFRADDKAAIEQRRARRLADLFQQTTTSRRLMVMVGEVKEFAEAREGRQVVIKNMPGFRLHLSETAWKSIQHKFVSELALWKSSETSHLMMIATISGGPAGIVTIEEIALMSVTEHWLPIEDAFEQALVERLARWRAKSVKCLRFNLNRDQPLASAVLMETQLGPAALYIVPPTASDSFEASMQEMIDMRPDLSAWVWRVAEGEMPPFPM